MFNSLVLKEISVSKVFRFIKSAQLDTTNHSNINLLALNVLQDSTVLKLTQQFQ